MNRIYSQILFAASGTNKEDVEDLNFLYSDIDNIFEILDILNHIHNQTINIFASSGLKTMVKLHRDELIGHDRYEEIKNILISLIIQNISNCRQTICECIFILIEKECKFWTELYTELDNLLLNSNMDSIKQFLDIFSIMYTKMDKIHIQSYINFISSEVIQNFHNYDEIYAINIVEDLSFIASNNLLSQDVTYELFTIFSEYLTSYLYNEFGFNYGQLVKSMCNFIKSKNLLYDPMDILNWIIGLLSDEIYVEKKCSLAQIVETTIEMHSEVLYQCGLELIEICLNLSSEFIIQGNLIDQENTSKMLDIIHSCVTPNNQFDLLNYIIEKVSEINPASICMAISLISEEGYEAVNARLEQITEIAKECLKSEVRLTKQASIKMVSDIIDFHEEEISFYMTSILEGIVPHLNTDDFELFHDVINVLNKILNCIQIEDESIQPIHDALLESLHLRPTSYEVVEAIGALAKSCMESITPYTSELFEILFELCNETDAKVNPLMLTASIRSLGKLLRYSLERESFFFFSPVLEYAVDNFQTDDTELYLTLSSLLSDIGSVCEFDFDPFVPTMLASLSSSSELMNGTLKTINSYAKAHRDDARKKLLPVFLHSIIESGKITKEKISTLVTLSAVSGEFIEPFKQMMDALLTEGNELALVGYRKLVDLNVPLDDSIIEKIFNFDNMENFESRDSIYYLFAEIALKFPRKFPYVKFWDHTVTINEGISNNNEELLDCVGVLVNFFRSSSDQMEPDTIEALGRLFFSSLEFCDMKLAPHPFVGARLFVERGFAVEDEVLKSAFEISYANIEKEYCGEEFYLLTVAVSISLILTIASEREIDAESASMVLPVVFKMASMCISSKFPILEASNIYECAAKVSLKYADQVSAAAEEAIKFLCSLMTMKKKKWQWLEITESARKAVEEYLLFAANSSKELHDFIQKQFDGKFCRMSL